ncbi:hypothetical protein RIF29_25111 [Crotalaria pallida]|uniref:Diacylglycerol kinase accessory domain-containing protein n=1 Tax=Crotalaria pallida TaxID=3830 RepID=A0AAN9ET69_CROPI
MLLAQNSLETNSFTTIVVDRNRCCQSSPPIQLKLKFLFSRMHCCMPIVLKMAEFDHKAGYRHIDCAMVYDNEKEPRSCSKAMKAVGVVEATCEEIFELVMSMDGTRKVATLFVGDFGITSTWILDCIRGSFVCQSTLLQYFVLLTEGMDAQVSYAFHSERKMHPEKFKNQLVNQMVFSSLVHPASSKRASFRFSFTLLSVSSVCFWSYLCQSPLKLSLFPRSFAERQMSLHLLFFNFSLTFLISFSSRFSDYSQNIDSYSHFIHLPSILILFSLLRFHSYLFDFIALLSLHSGLFHFSDFIGMHSDHSTADSRFCNKILIRGFTQFWVCCRFCGFHDFVDFVRAFDSRFCNKRLIRDFETED